MSQPPSLTTSIDLHGKLVVDAISEVTLFLERIRRRTGVNSSTGSSGAQNVLFVQIITGSGSHSPHGPVLRSAVQALLEKRCMDWRLECGGGSFQVDALSGYDLYDPGPATDSKVLITGADEFHQLASSRRSYTAGSYAGIAQVGHTVAKCASGASLPCTATSDKLYNHSSSAYPLPIQVALEDEDVLTATQLSITESQLHKNQRDRISKQNETDFQRALSESKLDNAVSECNEFLSKEEEERLLKSSSKQSLMDEQRRQQRAEKQYEEELKLAMELSIKETSKPTNAEGELQRALVESRALAEAENATYSIDDFLEKALAESILLEETRKLYIHEQEKLAASCEVDLLDKVKQLSLKQHHEDVMFEEEALSKTIEKSKHVH